MKRLWSVLALVLLLTACGSSTDQPTTGQTTLAGEVVASEIVVGDRRLAIGILDRSTPVSDAVVHARAFYLGTNATVAKGESDAPFKGNGLEGAGVYVAQIKMDIAGNWGVDLTVQRPNGEHAVLRLGFNVVANAIVPAVGQPAPLSRNPTSHDVDVTTIDSGNPPDDMHDISIADAIAQHRPTLVVFASPAFCQTRICGPEVKVVQSLEPTYKDRLTFVHIEIYRDFKPDPLKKQFAQTVLDWRLQTEPWIFLVDSRGVIKARFEGPTAVDEVKAGIDQLLATT